MNTELSRSFNLHLLRLFSTYLTLFRIASRKPHIVRLLLLLVNRTRFPPNMNNVGEEIGRYSKRVLQMFWDPLPNNDDTSPIWCLGESYESMPPHTVITHSSAPHSSASQTSHGSQTPSTTTTTNHDANTPDTSYEDLKDTSRHEADGVGAEEEAGWPKQFLDDFESRIWLTYRSNFPTIPRSQDPKAAATMSWAVRMKSQLNQGGFTSDTGWGCMIRSGQSMLANALLILKLGRDWRRGQDSPEERNLLSLFADEPNAVFSIHKFVEHGASACGKHPGEWFGPSATARCIQALCNAYSDAGMRVYVTGDSPDVYEDSFLRIAKSDDGSFVPTLILVGIRLGIDRVTPVYWEALKSSLQMRQSMGIAGGRPSASHYFIGVQGSYFFYLDPHFTRPHLVLHPSPASYTEEEVSSCHTRRIRRLHVKEMDPSMLIAFLIRDEEDWKEWRQGVACVQGKPIIHVADIEPAMGAAVGGVEREGAIDEVEAFDDTDDEVTV